MPSLVLALVLPAAAGPARWLASDHVAVGVADDGSFGNEAAGVGLYFDPDGTAGPAPLGGDVLLVGRTFETWTLQAGGATWVQAAADQGSELVLGWEAPQDDGAWTWLRGSGGDAVIRVDLLVALPWGQGQVLLVYDLLALEDLDALWLARTYDPDIDAGLGGGYGTTNQADGDAVVASGAVDGRAWALAAGGGQGGIGDWFTLPSEVVLGLGSSTGDDQLGVAVAVGDLAAGETARVVFAYGFGLDAEAALAQARAGAGRGEEGDALGRAPGDTGLPDTGTDGGAPDSGWIDREDWDQPIPGDSGEEDGGAAGDGGGPAGDPTDDDEDDGEDGAAGCGCGGGAPVALVPVALSLALSWTLARRRRR